MEKYTNGRLEKSKEIDAEGLEDSKDNLDFARIALDIAEQEGRRATEPKKP